MKLDLQLRSLKELADHALAKQWVVPAFVERDALQRVELEGCAPVPRDPILSARLSPLLYAGTKGSGPHIDCCQGTASLRADVVDSI